LQVKLAPGQERRCLVFKLQVSLQGVVNMRPALLEAGHELAGADRWVWE